MPEYCLSISDRLSARPGCRGVEKSVRRNEARRDMDVRYSYKKITNILLFFSVLLTIFIVTRLYFSPAVPLGLSLAQMPGKNIRSEAFLQPEISVSFDEYSRIFGERDVFIIPYRKEPAKAVPQRKAAVILTEQQADVSHFRLLGIVMDQHPLAIIEDTADKQTSFFSRGDSIGKGTLQDIQENKVVIMIHDSPVELLLEDK